LARIGSLDLTATCETDQAGRPCGPSLSPCWARSARPCEGAQRSVARFIQRRREPPSQSWRTFLINHVADLAAADFLVVPTATFRILFVFVVLLHHRRQVVHFNVTSAPTSAWTAQQILEAFPEDSAPRYLLRELRCRLWRHLSKTRGRHGHRRNPHCRAVAMAEPLRRAHDRDHPAGPPRPRDRTRRGTSSSSAAALPSLLPRGANSPFAGEGRARTTAGGATRTRPRCRPASSWWPSPSLRSASCLASRWPGKGTQSGESPPLAQSAGRRSTLDRQGKGEPFPAPIPRDSRIGASSDTTRASNGQPHADRAADDPSPTDEYVAYTCMTMAADHARLRLRQL
jgi:hypothetical protein